MADCVSPIRPRSLAPAPRLRVLPTSPSCLFQRPLCNFPKKIVRDRSQHDHENDDGYQKGNAAYTDQQPDDAVLHSGEEWTSFSLGFTARPCGTIMMGRMIARSPEIFAEVFQPSEGGCAFQIRFRESFPGAGNFKKLLGRSARAVGMMFFGQRPVSGLDDFRISIFRDPENSIIILLAHQSGPQSRHLGYSWSKTAARARRAAIKNATLVIRVA